MKLNQYKNLKRDSDKQISIFSLLQAQQNWLLMYEDCWLLSAIAAVKFYTSC